MEIFMKDYLNFKGKVAVITGGRRGLGRAMALSLAECGAKVCVISQSPEADKLLCEIRECGGTGIYVQADLSKRNERIGLIEKVVERFGGVNILINNAGMQYRENIETCTQEQWDYSRSIFLDAIFELSQQAVPFMKKQGGGKIINISSICAFREAGGNFSYGVMKGALISMTRCMANHLAQFNINVNAIAPGVIRTNLTQPGLSNPECYQDTIKKYPSKRVGEPEEIAGAMLFLASAMSSFVHGQTLIVDGGFTGN